MEPKLHLLDVISLQNLPLKLIIFKKLCFIENVCVGLFKTSVCYLVLKTIKMSISDDDLDKTIKLESDEDDISADKLSSKSELGPSSWPSPRPIVLCNLTCAISTKFKLHYKVFTKTRLNFKSY